MVKTEMSGKDDDGLEPFFAAARDARPEVSPDLMARILADADREIERRAAPAPAAPRRGWWLSAIALVGGWPAMAGMLTATIAGVWIGFAAPGTVSTLSGGVASSGYELEDMMPGYGDLAGILDEG